MRFSLTTRKMAETVIINFFRALDIEQRFAASGGTFILKMQLNFGKSEELGDIFNLPQFHPLLCSNMMTWKTNNLHSAVKTSRLAATRGSKMALELPVKIHFQKIIII